jgi:hypothetical protein
MRKPTALLLAVFIGLASPAWAEPQDDAASIMKKSHLALYYAGDDGLADVTMRIIDKRGKERTKEFTMLRLDEEEGGKQKYYTYFQRPSDVSRLTFMVHKNTDGNDMRWIYVPAVDLVRPISADDKNSSFVGSDFSYEDVSGRHWTEDNHELLGDTTIDDSPVWVIASVPKEPYKGFARRIAYVSKEHHLPLVEEYYDSKDRLIRIFRAEKLEEIEGINTVTSRSIENVEKGSRTYIDFPRVDYNLGLDASLFTERYLKNPPRKYIR